MDDAAGVGMLERAADVDRDRDRPVDLEPPAVALIERPGEISTSDVFADDVRDPTLLTGVEHPDDVRMLAELAHRLRLAARSREQGLLEPLGLEHRDRDLAIVGLGVAGLVYALAPAQAEEALDAVAPRDHLRGVRGRPGGGRLRLRGGLQAGAAVVAEASLGPIEIAA